MNKIKVVLDTQGAMQEFVGLATGISGPVYLEDGNGLRVNAKSLMGVLYGMSEFENLYVLSDDDSINTRFLKFLR